MRNEKIGIGAVKHDHLELGLSFGQIQQMLQLWNSIVIEQINRRVIEGDAPIGIALAAQAQLTEDSLIFILQTT